MLSLYTALQPHLPNDVVGNICTFLDFKALTTWRLVSKQAFLDVESHVRKLVLHLETKQFLYAPLLQEPTGLWLGSAWFQFKTNMYACKQCHGFQPITPYFEHLTSNYDHIQAEEEQICGSCFIKGGNIKMCVACSVYQGAYESSTCMQCRQLRLKCVWNALISFTIATV